MTATIGEAFVEVRARPSSQLTGDVEKAVSGAAKKAGNEAASGGGVKSLVGDLQSLFGSSTVTTTALEGFSSASTAASVASAGLAIPVIAGAAAVVGLTAAAESAVHAFTDYAAEVRTFQRVTATSAEEASTFAAVFDRLGVAPTAAARALQFMTRATDANRKILHENGVELAANADGSLNVRESFLRVADAVSKSSDAHVRNTIVQAAFSRGGLALLPVLLRGREGFEELAQAAKDAGLVLDEEGIQRSKDLAFAMSGLREEIKGTKVQIGEELAPAFITLAQTALPVVKTLAGAVRDFFVGLISLGETIAHPFDSQAEHLSRVAKIINDSIDSTKLLGEATSDLGDDIDAVNKAYDTYLKKQQDSTKAQFAAQDADFAFQHAQAGVAAAYRTYNELLNRSGQVARDLAAAHRDLARATEEVSLRTEDARAAEIEFGVNSRQARDARDALAAATDRQTDSNQKLADLNAESGAQGTKTLQASQDLKEARLKEKEAADKLATSNADLYNAVAAANGIELTAQDRIAVLKSKYGELAATLAPGSDLRANIQATADALVNVTEQAQKALAASLDPGFAAARIANAGDPGAGPGGPAPAVVPFAGGGIAGGGYGFVPNITINNTYNTPIDPSQVAQAQAAQVGQTVSRTTVHPA